MIFRSKILFLLFTLLFFSTSVQARPIPPPPEIQSPDHPSQLQKKRSVSRTTRSQNPKNPLILQSMPLHSLRNYLRGKSK